jgi:hypothetical protein
MKKILQFVILVCMFAACHDSNQASTNSTQSLREVGGAITKEEAERWTTKYKSSGSRQQSSTTISKASLQEVVNALPDYDGVYFHHALEGNIHHVIVIPYKDGQSLWTTTIAVDANSDSKIEVATASLWAERYVAGNSEGPWSHFFGRHIFETILSNEGFDKMEIAPAVNDAGLPQLLLYAFHHGPSTNGRAQGEVDVYDHSHICQPTCPN